MTAFESILLPTDLSPDSDEAFATALRLAIGGGRQLDILNVTPDDERPSWEGQPTIESWLGRWGRAEGSLGRVVVNVHSRKATSAAEGILRELQELEFDLVVMSTRGHGGLDRLAKGSVSEVVATRSGHPCLLLPQKASRTLVDAATGHARLQHVVLPVGGDLDQGAALAALRSLAANLGVQRLHVQIVHVGHEGTVPKLDLSDYADWSFDTRLMQSRVGPTGPIVAAAQELRADLIVMATRGRDSLFDLVVGSRTERVVHGAPCPVLAVPV